MLLDGDTPYPPHLVERYLRQRSVVKHSQLQANDSSVRRGADHWQASRQLPFELLSSAPDNEAVIVRTAAVIVMFLLISLDIGKNYVFF